MVVRILKEKYCPREYFWKAQIHRPSYAWRNIWNGNELHKACLVWRVGDGSNIKIWKDKWLLNPSIYTVQSPMRILDRDGKESKSLLMKTPDGGNSAPHSREI
jgi:hypothetical protein